MGLISPFNEATPLAVTGMLDDHARNMSGAMKSFLVPALALLLCSGCGWVRVVPPTPQLTPGRLAALPKTPLHGPQNLDFEAVDEKGFPEGWQLIGSAKVTSDGRRARSGKRAVSINPATSPSSLIQCVGARTYRGKKALLAGDLKSSGEARVSLRLRAIHPSKRGYALVEDEEERSSFYIGNVTDQTSGVARGTTWWARYRTSIEVPKDSSLVCYMVGFYGDGTVWADGLSLEVQE